MNKFIIFCDFDGTITQKDTLVYLLDKYNGNGWRQIEDEVEAGTRSEIEALQAEMDLLKVRYDEALDSVLAGVEIDATFPDFVQFARENDIELVILSGGFKGIIETILSDRQLEGLQVRSNQIKVDKQNRWQVIPAGTPKLNGFCNHCKTWHVEEAKAAGLKTIYIGDGTTDRCPASSCDYVFAKSGLADWLVEQNIKHVRYKDFDEISAYLRKIL